VSEDDEDSVIFVDAIINKLGPSRRKTSATPVSLNLKYYESTDLFTSHYHVQRKKLLQGG